ncbi:homocysteine biosynthesis protein [Helicovermis profundi]|uniref:Homocysteine biosynthesis enzyme sulfur-incorporation domain-containing protein n=1 Tax=Helicovermis profundi TaxID=3065157 RepID=A0AAU9E4U1_9FIRM|nr:hypothetical protein HLPR_19650 [Clostridia bacterium S502]
MNKKRTFKDINEKIKNGNVVVVTAEEIIDIVDEKGIDEAFELIDVVTTATFGPMCSTGAFLNFGHSDPPIRLEKLTLNNVEAYGGLAAVDTYIGATEESSDKGYEYGGAHVIRDLIDGKIVTLNASAKGTDCYPRKTLHRDIKLEDLNEAYLFNPRNCYQNYAAAINTTDEPIYTYMGTLLPNKGNINYSTVGELSPLLNDPYLKTIGLGTRIFIGGTTGYIAWNGTQFNTNATRYENGITKTPGATLALIGNLKEMSTEFINPAVFKKYGTSINVGVGIPIPILDKEILRGCAIRNSQIKTNIVDYSVKKLSKPVLTSVTYEELKSGQIELDGKLIKTAPLSSMKKARKIAYILKEQIEKGEFLLQEPIKNFDLNSTVKPLKKEAK